MIKFIKKLIVNILYFLYKLFMKKYMILDDEQTIDKILSNRMSIARYGDGEFDWMLGNSKAVSNNFQDADDNLSVRLKEVILNPLSNLLICIPYQFKKIVNQKNKSEYFWKRTLVKRFWFLNKYLNVNTQYGNSYLTRCYITYKDKSGCDVKFNNLRKLWNDRDVIIIEGKYSRLGVSNNLFDNVKSLKRILCPEKNAFSVYNKILDYSLSVPNDDNVLFLIALGPTATVLAYDLAKQGRQALDVGHVDIEYEWFLQQVDERVPIVGKYVNEVFEKNVDFKNNNDLDYEKSIIETIDLD